MDGEDTGTRASRVQPGRTKTGIPFVKAAATRIAAMKKSALAAAAIFTSALLHAQFQVNPQVGITYQQMTNPGLPSIEYRAAAGWQLGVDMRFGDRTYFQPGAFFGRNATMIKQTFNDTIAIEDDLVRTNLKLRGMVGYRVIDSYQFDVRVAMGPSYDVLLGVDNRHDNATMDQGDFRTGSLNWDASIGFDMGYFTLEPSASFGLSRVFKEDLVLGDLASRYITYGVTIGINLGNDD